MITFGHFLLICTWKWSRKQILWPVLAEERIHSYKIKLNQTIFKGMQMMWEKTGNYIESANQTHCFVKLLENLWKMPFSTCLPWNFFVRYKRKTKQQENEVMSLLCKKVMKSPPPSKRNHSLPALAATVVFKIEMNPKMWFGKQPPKYSESLFSLFSTSFLPF